MKMDMSHFKKIKEDESTATLMHPKGHSITISKKHLNKNLQKQLGGLPMHMADGGQIPELDPNSPAASSMPEPQKLEDQLPQQSPDSSSEAPTNSQQAYESAKKKLSQNQDAGVFDPMMGTWRFPFEQNFQQSLENASLKAAKDFSSDQSQKVDSERKQMYQVQAQLKQYQDAGVTPPQPLVDQMNKLGSDPGVQKPAPSNYTPVSAQVPQQAQQPGMMDQSAYMGPMVGYESGLMAEANAAQKQGNAIALAAKQQQSEMQTARQLYQQHYDELEKERQAMRQDIAKNHFDPNRYINSMSTGQKILNAFSMIAGGIGGALTKQENPAMKFLHQSIENDINSQKFEMDKKNNLLSENLKQFGNLKDASDMTRIMTGEMYLSKMRQAEAEAMGPVAKGRMQQAAAKFEMDYVLPTMQQMSMRRSLMNGNASGQISPALAVQYLVPPEQKKQAFEELKSMQDMSASRDEALSNFQKLAQLTSMGSRISSPIQSSKQIEALREPLVLKLARDAAGRVNEYELPGIRAMFPAMGDSQETLAKKQAQLQAFVGQKMHSPVLDSFGIKMPEKLMPNQAQISNLPAYKQVGYQKR